VKARQMKKPTALTDEEKRVVKALLAEGMRNQDIHALINYERPATINFGRTAGARKNEKIAYARYITDHMIILGEHWSLHWLFLHTFHTQLCVFRHTVLPR
jgi:hypothetical protein